MKAMKIEPYTTHPITKIKPIKRDTKLDPKQQKNKQQQKSEEIEDQQETTLHIDENV